MHPRWIRVCPTRALPSLLIAVLITLMIPMEAVAAEPRLSVTGEPTGEELAEIEEQWERFETAFGGFSDCMGPVEVRVVARAEDWYGGRNVGSIAAFYRFPPEAIVFIEHRKVVPRNLLHEFAHHLDISCGLGESATGDTLKAAQGLPEQRGWMSGGSWAAVPAEVFAEAVVAFFDEPTRIDIGLEAVQVIDGLTRVPTPIDLELVQVMDDLTLVPTPADPEVAQVIDDLARVPTTVVGAHNQQQFRAVASGILSLAETVRWHRLPVVN